jgi:hypothetical protein
MQVARRSTTVSGCGDPPAETCPDNKQDISSAGKFATSYRRCRYNRLDSPQLLSQHSRVIMVGGNRRCP